MAKERARSLVGELVGYILGWVVLTLIVSLVIGRVFGQPSTRWWVLVISAVLVLVLFAVGNL